MVLSKLSNALSRFALLERYITVSNTEHTGFLPQA